MSVHNLRPLVEPSLEKLKILGDRPDKYFRLIYYKHWFV